jgi:hypothetical protein
LIELWAENLGEDGSVVVLLRDDRGDIAELMLVSDPDAAEGVLLTPVSDAPEPGEEEPEPKPPHPPETPSKRPWPVPIRPRRRKRRPWFFLEVSVEGLAPGLYRCYSAIFVHRALQAVAANSHHESISLENAEEWGLINPHGTGSRGDELEYAR